MMVRIAQLEAFVRVAEEGGFTAAAKRMRISQSALSKSVADLEREVGVALFHRSTRALRLSEEGENYYERMKALLADWEDANHDLVSQTHGLVGKIRVNASNLLMADLVVPTAIAYQKLHPKIEFELVSDDRRVDVIQSSADLILRVGELTDSTFKSRRIGTAEIGLYASHSYLREKTMEGSKEIVLKMPSSIRRPRSNLELKMEAEFEGQPLQIEWDESMKVNNSIGLKALVLCGYGVGYLTKFSVRTEVASGALIELALPSPFPSLAIHALHSNGNFAPKRVEGFTLALAEKCRELGIV